MRRPGGSGTSLLSHARTLAWLWLLWLLSGALHNVPVPLAASTASPCRSSRLRLPCPLCY